MNNWDTGKDICHSANTLKKLEEIGGTVADYKRLNRSLHSDLHSMFWSSHDKPKYNSLLDAGSALKNLGYDDNEMLEIISIASTLASAISEVEEIIRQKEKNNA